MLLAGIQDELEVNDTNLVRATIGSDDSVGWCESSRRGFATIEQMD